MAQQTTTTQGPVDRAWLDDFLERWDAAWDTHEPDRVLALMTDDIVYKDSAWPKPMRGHGGRPRVPGVRLDRDARRALRGDRGPVPAPDEPKAAFYWRGTGTHTGPIDPPGLAPTGKSVEFYGADFHEYRDGKVARLRIVFDMADLMRQFGVLPPAGSREERMMAKVTNLRAQAAGRRASGSARAVTIAPVARFVTVTAGRRWPRRALRSCRSSARGALSVTVTRAAGRDRPAHAPVAVRLRPRRSVAATLTSTGDVAGLRKDDLHCRSHERDARGARPPAAGGREAGPVPPARRGRPGRLAWTGATWVRSVAGGGSSTGKQPSCVSPGSKSATRSSSSQANVSMPSPSV